MHSKFNRFAIVAVAAVLSVCLLSGCETLKNLASPQGQLAEQIAVQYATGKFIEAKPTPAARIERASKLVDVAQSVKAVAASDGATLSQLAALASAKVAAAHLSPADQLLAQSLVGAVVTELSARVAGGVLDADARLQVAKMLDWVIQAAAVYGAAPAV